MNIFGHNFRVSIFGESHGKYIGITVDGCPSGIKLSEKDFFNDLNRRKSVSVGSTQRIEDDKPDIVSGIFNKTTTGSPITILFHNKNIISKDYEEIKHHFRPGHADFTAYKKFRGYNDFCGGGHFSGRLTLGLVAAGVIAKKIIVPTVVAAKVLEIGGSKNFDKKIEQAIKRNDSVGGIIQCSAKKVPVGLGEPFFYSVESVISHIIFSIPAIKAIEFGAGFNAAKMWGSEHNDNIISIDGKTETNYAGGINGGITNGNEIIFKIAVKPTASIELPQRTLNFKTNKIEELKINGRHDKCIALRMPVIIEAATAIALADFIL